MKNKNIDPAPGEACAPAEALREALIEIQTLAAALAKLGNK